MSFRIIARLDVKPPHLVKGVHLEGLRRLGEPSQAARLYYLQGADEVSYQDVVASLYGRNSIQSLITETVSSVFIPKTVGGGLRSLHDARDLLLAGADKVSVNSAAVRRPSLVSELAEVLGIQAVVVTVEAKRLAGDWTVLTDGGREHSGRRVRDWVSEVEALGAGEIVLTSIDFEGTGKGFDLELIEMVRGEVGLPLVAHGGAGSPEDAVHAYRAGANAVALASVLHYGRYSVSDFKLALTKEGVEVRPFEG